MGNYFTNRLKLLSLFPEYSKLQVPLRGPANVHVQEWEFVVCYNLNPVLLCRIGDMDKRYKYLPFCKKYKVQIVANYKFPFLDMKMSWSPEGDLQFGVFRKKGQKLKYFGMGSNHTPSTIQAIPSGVLNRLLELTFRKNPLFVLRGRHNLT